MREPDMTWTDVERQRQPSPSDRVCTCHDGPRDRNHTLVCALRVKCDCLWCHPTPAVYQQEPCRYCGCTFDDA